MWEPPANESKETPSRRRNAATPASLGAKTVPWNAGSEASAAARASEVRRRPQVAISGRVGRAAARVGKVLGGRRTDSIW
jgi:hypothetical protein